MFGNEFTRSAALVISCVKKSLLCMATSFLKEVYHREIQMELIGIKEVMALLHISRPMATHLLSQPDCPTLPREKWGKYRVRKDAFLSWYQKWSA